MSRISRKAKVLDTRVWSWCILTMLAMGATVQAGFADEFREWYKRSLRRECGGQHFRSKFQPKLRTEYGPKYQPGDDFANRAKSEHQQYRLQRDYQLINHVERRVSHKCFRTVLRESLCRRH